MITIKQGDCLELMKELPDNSIDLVVTSPPYDDLRSYNGNVKQWNFEKFKKIANELYRIVKNGSVIIWVVGDKTKDGSESGTSFKQALYFKEIGFNLYDTMIYQKTNYVPLTHRRYEQCFEYIFCFSKGKPTTFNPIMIPCKNAGKKEKYGKGRRKLLDANQAMRVPDDVYYLETKKEKIHPNIFAYSCGLEKTGHPAVFPYKLAEDQILSWSNEGDIVLDPFMGSGTTGVACIKNNRNFIGYELDEKYFNIAKERLGV